MKKITLVLISLITAITSLLINESVLSDNVSAYKQRVFSIQRTIALPKVFMKSNKNHQITVEVAQSIEERSQGLMFRKKMEQNNGMLFIFPSKENQCFWMKNTLLPLSIAFLDDQGTIVHLDDMEPQTENPHCSYHPVRYALEMNQKWFEKNSLGIGDKIYTVAE